MKNSNFKSAIEDHHLYDDEVMENKAMLLELNHTKDRFDVDQVINGLKSDFVVLVKNVDPESVDDMMLKVSEEFGIEDNLKLQASYASLLGRRDRIGKFYMTPNMRSEYQFIPPHSESTRLANMQLASLYCYENTMVGGENVLMHVDDSSPCWGFLKEKTARIKPGETPLTQSEIAKLRAMLSIDPLQDILSPDDEILKKYDTNHTNFEIYDVLTTPKKSFSKILQKEVHTYWSNIAGVDHDSAKEYLRLLKKCNLFIQPPEPKQVSDLDSVAHRRIYHSGLKFSDLFTDKITHKLQAGDLIFQNNLTWTHSANNYLPNSGCRNIAVAFA